MSTQKIGRLALRHEGEFWVAYYAKPETMVGAVKLGSIAMRFVMNEKRKGEFMAMMQDAMTDVIEEATGARPTWPEGAQAAPEHERAGHKDIWMLN